MIKVPKQQPHCRNIRCLGVVVVLLLCELKCWYEATPAEAASFLPSTKKSVSPVELENPSLLFHRHLVSRRKHVLQTLKIWRIRHAVQPNIRFLGIPWTKKKNSRFKNRGFMFTFRKPTKENVGKWYGTNDGIDEDLNNDIQLGVFQKGLVNHDHVGMTNPSLDHSIQQCDDDEKESKSSDKNGVSSATPIPSSTEKSSMKWWPSFTEPPQEDRWRILTYRSQVGCGKECYDKVKSAILDWEFQNKDKSTGLINVVQSSSAVPKSRCKLSSSDDDDDANDPSMSWRRTIGSGRRMVSFASSKLPLLPDLYAINPVMVVYDLFDQRGPGTTFTSTAYATMKGHLFRGEERVTVCLRDDNNEQQLAVPVVDVEIISISKPAPTILAKCLWLFIGKKQNEFFELQMDHFKSIGELK